MGVQNYYIYLEDNQQRELDQDGIHSFLSDTNEEGFLFIREPDNTEITIEFNLQTGKVRALSIQKDVEMIYSFKYLTEPVEEAISRLAKRNLLLELYKLKEPEVSALIARKHFSPDGKNFINIDEATMNGTLLTLQQRSSAALFSRFIPQSEKGKIISEALASTPVAKITSGEVVTKIMDTIKAKLAAKKSEDEHYDNESRPKSSLGG